MKSSHLTQLSASELAYKNTILKSYDGEMYSLKPEMKKKMLITRKCRWNKPSNIYIGRISNLFPLQKVNRICGVNMITN